MNENLKNLYNTLVSNGYNPPAFDQFAKDMQNEKNLRGVYSTLQKEGYTPPAFDTFKSDMGIAPAPSSSSIPKQNTLVSTTTKPLGGGIASLIKNSGAAEAAERAAVDAPSYSDPNAVSSWLANIRGQAAHGTRSFNERSANLLEHAKKDPLGRNTVKSGFKYNKKTGDFEQTYLTPYGTRHTNKAEADEVSRQWRDANDHSIEKQIGEAYREQERLEREIDARGKEIEQGESAVGRAIRRGVSGAIAGSLGGSVGKIVDYITNPSDYIYMRADETYNQLVAASNANKERIKTLEAARDKGGFWRGAINTTTDPNTWLFGVPGLVDAVTLYTTSKKLEKNGGDTSKLTEAEKSMLDNVIANSNVQGEYGDDLGFMYGAGAVTANTLPFVAEFAITGGFSGLANVGARMGEKLATKAAAKGITGKASQWLIKNTGVAAGDIASSLAMANTTGAARTASNILDRHMGDATIDESGNYAFKGGENIATAAAKGIVSSTLEYYTEKLGGHLQLGKWLSKGAEKVGLSKLSKAINYASSNKWLEKGGVQDYPSEVLEEEANIVLNALLVGDNKFSDLWDAKTQADIWGGMAFSLGFMNAPKYANTGYQAAQYYRYKHKTDKSDAAASRQIGTEQWQELKEMIDGADNEHISDILNSEIIGNDNLNSESRKAAMDYAKNLLEMRGYNMGLLNSVRDDISDKEEDGNKVVDTTVGSSYSEGYNAADETEAATFEMEYGAARENAEQVFDEETLALLDDNPVYTLSALRSSEEFTDEALAIAVDYVNAKAARDGAEQRMADDLDSEIDAARGEVTQRINGDDFMIHGAQMKADNADGTPKRVHIISGNVSMREDGSVDAAKSSQTIVVRDAATGKVEMVSPEHIRSVDEAIDPQEEYAQAEAEARASYEQKKARVLEGRTEELDVPGETDVPGENLQTETPQAEIKGKEEQAKNQQIEEEQGNPPQIKPQAEGENLQTEMQAEAESPIVEQAEIPVEKDKKGNVVRTLYHRVPMQRTLEDLYDGSLDQEEIDRFVENLAADAKRRLASVENENKPKIGNNKQAYLEAKKRHEDKLSDARAEVEYYDKLQKEVLRVTQRGGQQTGVAEDLGGDPLSLEELAARFASEYKVTPESLKGETGMSGNELKGFVGLVAKEENGGVSIERLGELLARSDEWAQLGGTPEMTQEARNMLIDAYMSGNPRSYVKQQRERFAQREAEHEMSEIENFAQAAFGMSAEEYLAYEEQALPAIINKYAGFDFDIYYAILQEQADARESEAEANNNNSINGNTNEQQGESNGNGGRGGILQTEGTADEQGERTSDEQETGGQGSVGNAGLQGVGTQGNVGEGERANTDDRRGGNGSLAGREQGGLAQEEVNYQLSDEVDENGRQFVLNSDGEIEFGRIGEDTGLTPAPILLSEGIITNQKTNAGYGLLHIEARHGNQIRAAGYGSVLEFIEEVAKNYEVIRKGNDRDGRKTYMLQLTDKHNNTLIVELSGDGTYWNINTAGIFKTSYGANRDVVYDRHTTDNQPAETDGASLSGEQSGTTPSTSMNAPAQSYKNGALDNTTDTGKTHKGNGNDTATPENTVVSVGKVTEKENSVQTSIANAEAETETAPSEAQKKAGNYKKGHLKIDGFDVTIENPKGSVRSGVDADGEKWEQTMNNTYGYIRGTEGVDGDHIDVFLSDNPANGDVFVVDQVNKDGTFDEHKVMYGFSTEEEARNAYLSNYEDGWTGLGAITRVSKEEFKKWVNSSHRKTKPFAEYKGVKKTESTGEAEASNSTRSAFDNLKKQASDRMLIFKEGGNYEILYEDAKKAAEILGLTVQKKDGKTFVSFPIKDLDKNLPLLIREGVRVAITDELVNTKNRKAGKAEVPGRTEVPGSDAENTAVSVKGSMLSEEESARLSELRARDRKSLERRELEEMLTLERKERILREGTTHDESFGLKPASEISRAEDIDENVSKIIKGLKAHEGDGRFKDFEGFSYGGNYAKNAGRQIDEYLQALIDVIPFDITKAWCESHGLETHEDAYSYGERLYNAKKTEGTEESAGKNDGNAATDNQGNPLNEDGTLKLEKIASVDELTDEDFSKPTRNVELPALPKNVNDAIGANGKPVIIKKNIFEKNKSSHKDLTADDGRKILSDVLYNPNLYGQNQKTTRPYNWILVHLADKNEAVIVEVNDNKDNIEIVNWHYLTDQTLEQKKRQAVKEGSLILTLESAVGNTLNDLSSDGKDSDNSSIGQGGGEKVDGGKGKKPSPDTKIDDVGERLEGARKDMRRKIAESLANVTEADLIEKPFGKVYKKPDLKKAVESGALREKDAIFYEALFSMVDQQKPKVTQRDMRSKRYIPDYKTKAERWAADTFKQMEVLRQFMELDEPGRDAMMERMLADLYPTREQELADIEKRKDWNPDYEGHKYEWGEMTTPNPLWVTYEVMNRMGYDVGDKLDIPYGVVKANTSGTGYSIENLKGEYAIIFGSSMTLDEAIDRIVYLAKLKRGGADISHPTQLFDFPATKSEMGESGRFRVIYGRDFKTREFDSKEEADAFASTKSGAHVSPVKEVKRWFGYKVRFCHPLTGEKTFVDDAEFDTKNEAQEYFDGNFERINDATNEKLQEERERKGEKKTLTPDDVVNVTMVKSDEGWSYAVVVDKKYANNDGMAHIIKEGFASSKDAHAYADKVKDDIFNAIQKHKEEEKSVVFFDTGEDSRIGEDWRNGKDVEAEDFMNTFGFRGVQFGNWTNQEDRQMAVNQAYDAFMDLASLIGVSPSVLSLNGELGIAFGARGMGNASAHYEPNNVVINLTKTRGAGSLAHEWWHALDNYLARRSGKSLGMVTSNRSIEMREELRNAFNAMLDMVGNSEYAKRSAKKGDYWGRIEEVTARLLSEWVDKELKNNGKLNTFLSRGVSIERYQKHNYNVYTALEKLSGREPMSFEEYKETPESLVGIPYPTAKEVEQFGASLRNIFDTLQEKVDEKTGKIALFHKLDGNTKLLDKQEFALRDVLVDDVLRGAAGMEVITDAEEGQRVLDEENLGDMRQRKVSDVRFFRTPDGHAYGFTMGGKIYIDARIAGADTPIHEYTHLWAEALRKANPKEWDNIVGLMKGGPLWEGVKKKYPDLKTDSEIADEVLAHYSGKRGAERLRKAQEEALKNGNGILERTAAVAAINNVRTALKRFWKGVAGLFGVHFNSAEEVADKILSDMLNGVKPEATGKTDAALAKEEADIIAKAKADGTYLKAPNGKLTNLTPRQWVQVRTKAFKKWFGDWEKRLRIEKLRKSESASIAGNEIEITDDYKQNKKNALEYGKRLQGEYTNADTGVSVQLQRGRRNGGINEVLQHNYKDAAHILSVAAIPQIIEKSVYIESEANSDTAKNPDVVEYQHFVCGLKIGNEDYTVHSLVAVDKHGNRYYYHNLTHIEKTKLLDSIERQAVKGQGFDTTSSTELTTLNGYKGKKLLEILQTNSSKVVDENGEPLVVYHGTTTPDITTFDLAKTKSGQAFWFANMEAQKGVFYSDQNNENLIMMPLFINMRTPLLNDADSMESYATDETHDGGLILGKVKDLGFSEEEYQELLDKGLNDNSYLAAGNVANPNQLKSATDNIGSFSSNPDIRYQFVDENGSESAAETEAEELARDGRGAYTDDKVSMENDPWSKMAGYNIRSKKERMAFAERERRRMVDKITDMAERLGIAGDVEIVTDLSGLQGRQRRAKGIYRKSSGKITIYIPNHINVADAVATFLHEAVAHKGLRNLFGKHFDEFLDKVYANSESEIRSAIDALAKKKKLSTRTATEEYLAGLAEKTDFEHLPYNGWLQRVKTFFIEMLGKMGIKALDTTTLTDNELRYILWRSYRYMQGKDKGIIAFVEDTAMKMKLGVGYSEKEGASGAAEVAGKTGASAKNKKNSARSVFDNLKKQQAFDKMFLFKVGDNYEILYEDAKSASEILGLPLQEKDGKTFVSFPVKELDKNLALLVRGGAYVAVDNNPVQELFRDGETEVPGETDNSGSIEEVNERFNERLSELVANPDQKDRVLHLGNASGFLRAGGLLDAEILLEFDKLLRKSRSNYKNNHPFDISDANNLPLAIHNPIAIFDNTNDKESGRVILTELKKNGRNFIVVVQAKEQRRKGGVLLEINEISTLYPKEAKGVIKWLIDGNATNIDKNKALRFIEELQPLAGTTIKSEELVSAAKIVENFENPKIEGENSEEVDAEADELFREAAEVDKTKAATIYNNRIKSGMYQTYEAILDSMAGLKESMMSVLKAEGSSIKYIEDVPDSENAYLGENRLSSVNEAECEAFQRTLFDTLLREVANIAKTDKERRELTDYMMMKHGLERNAYMRKEAAKKKEETDRDFAGLTTLLGIEDVYEAEAEAQRLVEEYEAGHNTDTLWKCVKDVTRATLRKSYECGIISKDTFYKTILMYDYYIPLRGFSDKTSSEEYTYLNHSESSFNAPIRTARGRSSKADDPILQMQLMAESAILQGNRNRFVKQRFLNFAEHHPSDLISVRSVWLKYDDALEEWRPVFADINEYDTPEEALRKQEEFDERMEALAESDKEHFKKQSEHPEIPYRVVEKRDLREHQVLVKRGGIDYVLTINGSPRAAQAVNGKTNPDNVGDNAVDKVLEFCGNINRTLSMLYTTASPDFVVGNFARDCIYANTIVWAKEGAKYASKFNVNYAMLSKPGRMKLLFEKYRKGKLDMSNERERLFLMFIKNGGETGFLRMGDIDQYRDKIKKKLRDINAKIPAGEMIASAATWIGEVGRAVETQARFAAFMTSMQAGRSIGRSIWDAKEISVNFNKKGAGDKFMGGADQTKVGNVSAFTSALGRCLYVFWNAGLQGTFNNFGKTLVRNPKKTTAVMAASFALGLIVSMLGKMAGDDDGDDNGDDEETDTFGYYDISKHTRRQNLVVKIPGTKSWFKLPLPIEFRAMYGMGELAGSTIFGGEPLSAGDMLAQVSQLAPIDAMEGWRALIPSLAKPAADAYVNETWYGTPIYKDTPFNKYMPEWTKAPKNTNKYLVDLAATLNEMTGGDKYSKGKIDINPAIWEYLLRQYGGGIFTVASQLTSLYSVANGSKEADWRYVPLLNRFVMSSGDHKATPGLNERYFEIMDKLKSDDNRISAIKKDYAIGQDEQRKLIGEVVNDEMYRTLKAFDEEYKARKEGLDYYQNIGDVENAKKAAREIKELKMRAVEYANKKEKEE